MLRWIRGLPVEGVNWRSFPGLGIRGGIDGCTPTVVHDAAGRRQWDIPPISGACLSPMGVHAYSETGTDLDDAVEADLDPWSAIHRITRWTDPYTALSRTDLAVWEILLDGADHVDKRITARRLASDGAGRDPDRIRRTHAMITRALLARTKPATAVIADQRLHPVA